MNIFEKLWVYKTLVAISKKLKGGTMLEKLKSRKLLITLGTGILILLNRALNLGIDDETITKLVGLVVGYDIGQGVADLVNKK